jgi:hypothetical protein
MIIYYPTDATVYTRQVGGQGITEQFISYAPDQVIIISGSTQPSASTLFVTASYALTYATMSSLAITASYALTGGGAGVLQSQVFS